MKGYAQDIESVATGNNDFRRVLYTVQEDIGADFHNDGKASE